MSQSLSFGVELDDVLHRFWIFLPVERLQVMTCHDVDLLLSRDVGEQDYLLSVPGFQQGFHGLDVMGRKTFLFIILTKLN